MAVSVRTRLATEKDLCSSLLRNGPVQPNWAACRYASFNWPRIWASPTTIESRLAATMNR
ncbi:MAG: hypothetical protein ACD_75C02296G0003 [uncultured bacterium]|nr:MAG: hypothetical protein ACD_75C02296G0003 [uncultured bacterium]